MVTQGFKPSKHPHRQRSGPIAPRDPPCSYEICLIGLALGLLAVAAGAPVTPVVLLVALAYGVWRPRS